MIGGKGKSKSEDAGVGKVAKSGGAVQSIVTKIGLFISLVSVTIWFQ